MSLSEKTIQFGSATWEKDVLGAKGPVLVDFWAPWCPPCRVLGPVIDDLATTYEGRVTIGKVNVDEHQELAERYGIQSIPTLMLFQDGQCVARQLGAAPKDLLAQALDDHLAKASAAVPQAAATEG
jgi:thioredoxin 1